SQASDNMRILTGALLLAVLGTGLAQQLQQPDPCEHRHRVVGDITYCDRYWECVSGTPQNYDCPNGLVFVGRNRGIAEGCDYPWRGAYCDNKQLANPPLSTEHCDWLYGIFGHETSCTRYWTCWNGTATEQFCIGGLLYNEETHACDWPSNVRGCQKHPLCTEDPDANVPLGSSCERYWACQGGYPRLQRCPATLVFDKQSRRCIAPPTQDCEAPTTTEAPLGEGTGFRGESAPRPQPRPRTRPQPRPTQSRIQQQPQQQRPTKIAPQSSPERPFVPAGAIPVRFNDPEPQGGFAPQQQGGFSP
ncbi:unnamed protein product, partial [Meganyctiphanes norvegica]